MPKETSVTLAVYFVFKGRGPSAGSAVHSTVLQGWQSSTPSLSSSGATTRVCGCWALDMRLNLMIQF